MPCKSGDILHDQYEILSQIGRGGFGYVYHARDVHLREDVAIKELIPGLVGDEASLKRFLAEAKATMRLRHERIVATHTIFPEAGNYYIVMELMAGGTLEDRLRHAAPPGRTSGRLPVADAVRWAAQVCEGLAYAHRRGVVHCDLKPANVLFDAQGEAKIADFGIAHVSDAMLSRTWHTPQGFTAGTLPYMSPEQTRGTRDDPRVDVYAVGAILYRMLTGRTYLDFDVRETPAAQAENVLRILNEAPRPPSLHQRDVPPWLDAVVVRALAKAPAARYPDASALRSALLDLKASPPPVAKAPAGRHPDIAALPTALVETKAVPSQPVPKAPEPRVQPGAAAPAGEPTRVRRRQSRRKERRVPAPRSPEARAAAAAAPVRRGWIWLLVAAIAVVLVLVTLGVLTLTGVLRRAPEVRIAARKIDGALMVYVEAGPFTMGSAGDEGASDEQPQHTVTLGAFWIDRTEVTNEQYIRFLNDQGAHLGACGGVDCVETKAENVASHILLNNGGYGVESGFADHPVIGVTWFGAVAYCAWAGAGLPTEAQWEKAARGTDARTYPWGDADPSCSRVQYAECGGQTVPVDSSPAGASPYGALHMAGNVWEWVKDWYSADFYGLPASDSGAGPRSGSLRVLRGGAWNSEADALRVAARHKLGATMAGFHIGFRCVLGTSTVSP